MPGVGDTRCVPWAEWGNGGTVSQVTVLRDWDEELDAVWWVVSQGTTGGGGGQEGEEEEAGDLLFRTRNEVEAHLREALEQGDDGGDGDDGDDEGGQGGNEGEGGDKGGEEGGEKGGEKEGHTADDQGGAGSKHAPRQHPTTQEG